VYADWTASRSRVASCSANCSLVMIGETTRASACVLFGVPHMNGANLSRCDEPRYHRDMGRYKSSDRMKFGLPPGSA
jgi:hypothetical protein